jgi:hypothetical protein
MGLFDLWVGPRIATDGSPLNPRALRNGGMAVGDVAARYQEQAFRGNGFWLDSDSVTQAAAHNTKGALGTVKFINGFYNPTGSGKNAVIWTANVGMVSGTAGGPYFYNYLTGVVISSASTGTIRAALLGAAAASVMVPMVSVVLASATPTATANLLQLGMLGGPAAIAAGAGINSIQDEVAGRIIVPPGCVFGICGLGSATPVLQSTLTWDEIPV